MPITVQDLIKQAMLGGGSSGSGGGGWPGVPDDGATYLYITLAEGRTSPMLGVGVKGTVTVDWGDDTEPDVLTGTSVSTTVWTQNHAYAAPGNYVIRLVVDGEMAIHGEEASKRYSKILRYASGADYRNSAYQIALKRAVLGNGVALVGDGAFKNCFALTTVDIKTSVAQFGYRSFEDCYSLMAANIPDSLNTLGSYVFDGCYSLTAVKIPPAVTTIPSRAFADCYAMAYYDFTEHTSVPVLEAASAFSNIPSDCEIRVPAALYDEWIAATNWATYASQIVAY